MVSLLVAMLTFFKHKYKIKNNWVFQVFMYFAYALLFYIGLINAFWLGIICRWEHRLYYVCMSALMKNLIHFDFEQQDIICYLEIIKEVYVVKIGFWIELIYK